MSINPKVSIIIPAYNASNYLSEAIDSALNQTYKNIEIIIVNDGSNDNGETQKIAQSYGNKIKYFEKKNGGVSTALNLGIKNMTGEYFSWLSHDDRYYPNKIETQINYLQKNNLLNSKIITYTNYDVIDENSNIINIVNFKIFEPNKKPEYALLRGLISGTALLIPKKAFIEYGLFNENYRCIQDYLLFFNFMKTYKYIFIDAVTNSTRIHSQQVTNMNPKVIYENNFLWTYMQKELSDDIKIKLEGSLYKFYIEMYKFLTNHNKYIEAQNFSLKESDKYLQIEEEKLSKIIKNSNPEKLLYQIKKSFKYLYCFIKNKTALKYEIFNIINNIGIENTINFIYSDSNIKNIKIRKEYEKIINNNYTFKLNIFQKIKKCLKIYGLFGTCSNLYNKIKNELLNYKFIKILFKFIHWLRKVLLYIPKKIILFILNS